MSKLQLINEIQTAIKMAVANGESVDNVKLTHYLDDLLSNYEIEQRDELDLVIASDNYLTMYLESLSVSNYSPRTLESYRYQLAQFARFLGDKSLLKVTTNDVRRYLAFDDTLKPSTLVTKLDCISSFYNWLINEDELLKNPCAKIKRPKIPKKLREGLTIIELEQVRAACAPPKQKHQNLYDLDAVRKRALVEVLYSTACRLDELHKLNINDIDWHSGAVIVCGKGNKERRVYLSEKARFYLEKYLEARTDDCEALFATIRRPIHRMDHSAIQHIIRKIGKTSGINRPVHPHIFRHTFAQQALDAGMPIEDLQAYLGHEKADTTARYATITENRKLVSFNKYHQQ